jgi:ribosomal-protein-alanine N-acetyltransferase
MSDGSGLITPRLRMRRWSAADREPFAAMNADPDVMEHFPALLSRRESDAVVDRVEDWFDEDGYSWWALERRTDTEFLGFTGLSTPRFDAPFMPAVEVGWRLRRSVWGHGYATEAATAALDFGFDVVGLEHVVSMTSTTNLRSQAVMRRLGMTHDPSDDFDHPSLPVSSPLRRHVLYRTTASQWAARDR